MIPGDQAVDVGLADLPRLGELVNRDTVTEVLVSFHRLFGVPVRVFDAEGVLVADVATSTAARVCRYVDGLAAGRAACERTIGAAKSAPIPDEGEVVHACFTGAAYKLFALESDGRAIGKVVLGPYVPAETREVPRSLLAIDGVDAARARAALADMPRVPAATAEAMASHLRAVLDVILFAGHRALLMAQMHVASVREAYRELEAKNAELNATVERLRELDRLKSNFLATVSHELRTPLTSIIGYSEMLAEGIGGKPSAEQLEFVSTIRERSEQLLGLITSLLDLAKLEQGAAPMSPGAVPLGRLAAEVAATFMPRARRANVQLRVSTEPDAPDARGDRERLRQVLTNLVDNALKFTPSGGRVALSVRSIPPIGDDGGADDGLGLALLGPARRDVEVRVQDTGVGIPEHERARVFDAFYQVDGSSTREYGGAGLGLSIVKRIVDSHGGRVTIESDPGVPGTTFVVQLRSAATG